MSSNFGRCSICTLPFEFDDISALKCGHTYHNECISTWINHAKNCPKCRMKNMARDITRLYVDEPDRQNSVLDNAANTEQDELKANVKKLDKELTNTKDIKLALEITLKDCEKKVRVLECQLDKEKQKAVQVRLKDEHIKQLESQLADQNAIQRELNDTRKRLKACDFYTMISLGKHGNQAEIDKIIDKFATANGDPNVGEFLKAFRKQAEASRNDYRAEITKINNEKQALTKKLEAARKELAESRKRKVESTNGQSPASSASHAPRPRPSLGFSFHEIKEDEFPGMNDSDIQILSDGPFPAPKQLQANDSCIIYTSTPRVTTTTNNNKIKQRDLLSSPDGETFSFFDDLQPGTSKATTKAGTSGTGMAVGRKNMLDLVDLDLDIFSENVRTHASNAKLMG